MREKKRREATGFGFTETQLNEGEQAAESVQVQPERQKKMKIGRLKRDEKRD